MVGLNKVGLNGLPVKPAVFRLTRWQRQKCVCQSGNIVNSSAPQLPVRDFGAQYD